MNGIFYGVSVGPGDPELLTLKAVKILEKTKIIASPRTISESEGEKNLALDIAAQVVDLSQKEILKLDFIMSRNTEKTNAQHEKIGKMITDKLKNGEDVAMVNLGDASLYATFSYIMEIVKKAGFSVEIIAGVPSFCAVAAKLQTSLTTMKQPLHILPGGSVESIIPLHGTKVVMKTGKTMGEVKKYLESQENSLEVCGVELCGLENERIFQSVEEIPEDSSYFTTLIIK